MQGSMPSVSTGEENQSLDLTSMNNLCYLIFLLIFSFFISLYKFSSCFYSFLASLFLFLHLLSLSSFFHFSSFIVSTFIFIPTLVFAINNLSYLCYLHTLVNLHMLILLAGVLFSKKPNPIIQYSNDDDDDVFEKIENPFSSLSQRPAQRISKFGGSNASAHAQESGDDDVSISGGKSTAGFGAGSLPRSVSVGNVFNIGKPKPGMTRRKL